MHLASGQQQGKQSWSLHVIDTYPGKFVRLVAAGLLLGLVAGCAQMPEDPEERALYEEANDPFEEVNRAIFGLNLTLDHLIVRPFAAAYSELPQGIRDSVRNFLRNLKSPVILANNLLQGDIEGANDTMGRFLTNTIIGGGGLFDVAYGNGQGIPYREEDFGQTLAVWGAGEGPYLQLPLLGPSNVRDTVGLVGDFVMDPFNWWARNSSKDAPDTIRWTRRGAEVVDGRSRNMKQLEDLEATSLDFYSTIRSLYRQQRDNMIRNGDADSDAMPLIRHDFEIDIPADAEEAALLDQE